MDRTALAVHVGDDVLAVSTRKTLIDRELGARSEEAEGRIGRHEMNAAEMGVERTIDVGEEGITGVL